MEREDLERPGFPPAQRRYDPAAVDAQLRRAAVELGSAGTASHARRAGEAADGVLVALDRLQAELDRLVDGLQSTAASLAGSLDALTREVGTLGAAPDGRSDGEAGARR